MGKGADGAAAEGCTLMRREVAALLATAIVLLACLVAYLVIERGPETTPAERTGEQNSGSDAPSETLPSPGTVEDPQGEPAVPPQGQ